MSINENEFFREATLRICGSLNVEQALMDCLQYIQDVIPADRLGFSMYDPAIGTIRTLAVVSPAEILTPKTWPALPAELRTKIDQYKPGDEYVILNRLAEEDIGRFLSGRYGIEDFALLSMTVWLDGRRWGNVFLHHTTKPGVYTPEHAHLLGLLRRPFTVAFSNCLQYRELQQAKDLLAEEYSACRNELRCQSMKQIIGEKIGLQGVMESVSQVAPLDSPVLLLGETGTGKEVIAGAIHDLSSRRDGPFITVNCGAIPEALIDSDLFGHEKGAFTGAAGRRLGRFERADGGTIFLDEVGELPLEAQVRLLRVLQQREIERVGGAERIPVDIRIIAATHRNLEAMLEERLFRKDLYFRLSVFPIHIPPLRERVDDVPLLVHHFIEKKCREIRVSKIPSLAEGAIDRLMAYDWPGNVRELENVVERELIRSHGQPLAFLGLRIPKNQSPSEDDDVQEDGALRLDDVVSRHIERVLRMTRGRVHGDSGAAHLLDVNPATLRKRMNKLGILYGRKARVSDQSQ